MTKIKGTDDLKIAMLTALCTINPISAKIFSGLQPSLLLYLNGNVFSQFAQSVDDMIDSKTCLSVIYVIV